MRYLCVLLYAVLLLLPVHAVAAGRDAQAAELMAQGQQCFDSEMYSDAVDYYMRGMSMAKASGDTHTYCGCLNGIGMVYVRLNDLERGLVYFNKSYAKAVQTKDRDLQARNLAHMVCAYCFNNELDEAKKYYAVQKSFKAQGDSILEYYDMFNGALIAQLDGRNDVALRLHQQAIDYATKHRMDDKFVSADYGLLVYVFIQQGRTDDAKLYCEKYRQYAELKDTRTAWKSYYEMLADVYTSAKDAAMAESCSRKVDSLSVAIITQAQIDAVDNKVVKFEQGQSEEDILALNNVVDRQWLTILLGLGVILLLVTLFVVVYSNNRHLRRAQQLLVKKNEELIQSEKLSRQLLDKHYNPDDNAVAAPQESGAVHAEVRPPQDQVNAMLGKIAAVMEDVDTISSPDFNLSRLAALVGSNTKYVSWVINNVYHKNFKSYLNEYRIREACRRLEDDEHYGNLTIQAVYKDLGYSSASNFISAFKTVNGMTPSMYLKLVKENKRQSSDM